MKKQYMTPEIGIVKLEQKGMLCMSGEVGGDATEPAHARMFDFEDDFEDE